MRQRLLQGRFEPLSSFDMTPIIDVVFLLIIFFLLVYRFIGGENPDVFVPDSIRSAVQIPLEQEVITTVTVGRERDGQVFFKVGSASVEASALTKVPSAIAELINQEISQDSSSPKIVRLRCDKKIPFGLAKYALKGIVQSAATDIQWSVLKEE